jgi:RimJ/RimL family protein N-acetyltransferase
VPQLAIASLDTIMALERGEGFDRLVGRWSREEHVNELSAPGSLYLLWREGGEVLGFVMLQGLDNPHRTTRLRRIAMREPGRGEGSALLRASLDHCFSTSDTRRLELMVFTDNERARRAYIRAGFSEEGVHREVHRAADGAFRSMRMMSILRPEWEAGARA